VAGKLGCEGKGRATAKKRLGSADIDIVLFKLFEEKACDAMPLLCNAKTVAKSVQLSGCNDKGGTSLQTATKLTWIIAGIATVQPSLLERGSPAQEVARSS
jgi:hypothetical protein